jgi:hypothetical protein
MKTANAIGQSCSLLALLSLAAACERDPVSAFAVHRAGHGTADVYNATFEEVWEATHLALRREPGRLLEDHMEDSPFEPFVITKPSVLDQVGVWFLPEGSRKTLVKVVVTTGIESTSGIVGTDESTVQRHIANALALVRQEEQAPRAPP